MFISFGEAPVFYFSITWNSNSAQVFYSTDSLYLGELWIPEITISRGSKLSIFFLDCNREGFPHNWLGECLPVITRKEGFGGRVNGGHKCQSSNSLASIAAARVVHAHLRQDSGGKLMRFVRGKWACFDVVRYRRLPWIRDSKLRPDSLLVARLDLSVKREFYGGVVSRRVQMRSHEWKLINIQRVVE